MGNYHARCGAGEKPEVETPEAYLSLLENKNLKEETLLEKDNFREIADRKNDAYFANNF